MPRAGDAFFPVIWSAPEDCCGSVSEATIIPFPPTPPALTTPHSSPPLSSSLPPYFLPARSPHTVHRTPDSLNPPPLPSFLPYIHIRHLLFSSFHQFIAKIASLPDTFLRFYL
ncbi:hypothetical protein E2C01_091730 [Portunus trituberculatus]|uniref:Uncharacterized protein n=1 Tax=Portunus trituberculatus TaxID=210409 RepID=A0A5B7JNQ9_PORTR|nr:hypothetical protein [Portunus trituberculatus]